MIKKVEIDKRILLRMGNEEEEIKEKKMMSGMIMKNEEKEIERGKWEFKKRRECRKYIKWRKLKKIIMCKKDKEWKWIGKMMMRKGKSIDGKKEILDENEVLLVNFMEKDKDCRRIVR